MNNNDMMFVSIIKSSNMDQNVKQELLNLHSRQSELGNKIRMKKYMEYKFNQLKIEELNERIDEMKFQNKFFIKRNKNILEEIAQNDITSFELASNSNQILENLIRSKNNYQNYLNSLSPKILNQFNALILQNNILSKELNKIKENEKKNNYYKQLLDYNDNILKEIDNLKKKNNILNSQNKEKEKMLQEKEQSKINSLVESGVNKEDILKATNNGSSYIDLMPNKPLLKQYVLNDNHVRGKLDDLKKEQIEIINAQLKKEYDQKYNKDKDLLNDSQNSLDDLRNQILPPAKFYNPEMGGTLNQNFNDKIKESNFYILNSNIKNNSLVENKKKEIIKEPIREEINIKPKKEDINKVPVREEIKIKPNLPIPVISIADSINSEFRDCEVKDDENKNINEEENKNEKKEEEIKEEEIKEKDKEEIDYNDSAHKIDNEEKKEKEMKETINGEEIKESKNEEIDGSGSNHDYDDFEQDVV